MIDFVLGHRDVLDLCWLLTTIYKLINYWLHSWSLHYITLHYIVDLRRKPGSSPVLFWNINTEDFGEKCWATIRIPTYFFFIPQSKKRDYRPRSKITLTATDRPVVMTEARLKVFERIAWKRFMVVHSGAKQGKQDKISEKPSWGGSPCEEMIFNERLPKPLRR